MGKKLPYDAEVEYLKNTGTQWIDTEMSFPNGFRIVTDFLVDRLVTSWFQTIAGFELLDEFNIIRVDTYNGKKIVFTNGTWSKGIVAKPGKTLIETNRWYSLDASNVNKVVNIKLDGVVEVSNNSFANYAGPNCENIWLFGLRHLDGRNTHQPLYGAMKEVKLYDEKDVLVCDFVPVRKDKVGYMYDRVSGRLFGNIGTGDFVIGPDVSGGGLKLKSL